jgi:transcriptional regulator with XRE-family HTH domain
MDAQWARLGAAFAASRGAQNLTQDDVVTRADISLSTVQAIERGGPFKGITASMRLYAVLLGWAPGSIDAVLQGGEPTELPAAPGAAPALRGVPYRIAQALADGTALDTRLKRIGPGGEVVIILKGREGATEEEMRAVLREWERQEGHLERLGEVADDTPDRPGR